MVEAITPASLTTAPARLLAQQKAARAARQPETELAQTIGINVCFGLKESQLCCLSTCFNAANNLEY